MARTHTFPADSVHHTWHAGNAPEMTIESGDTVVLTTRDVSDGQLSPAADASIFADLDWDRSYPLAGPIAIDGAEPGDTLAIEVVDLQTKGWGWTAIIPGLGLLTEDFPDAYLRIFDLTTGDTTYLREDIGIPVEPFLGTMGVCPVGADQQRVMPPGVFGGNIDTRQLTVGSTLYLPVQVPGALFSCGDAHAAQGDGEVAISGIECAMRTTIRVSVVPGLELSAPALRRAPGSLTPRVDDGGWYATTGVEPDLMEAARAAVRSMIRHLVRERGLSREDAYVLCSLAGDLKITEVVDAPNWMVACFMPDSVFTG